MSEVLEAPARPASRTSSAAVGGELVRQDVREARPVAPVGADRRVPGLGRGGRRPRRRGGGGAFPAWAPCPRRSAARSCRCSRRDRAAGRADRAGHDAGDGQAAARGAHGSGALAQILRFFAGEALRPNGERFEQAATGSVVYTSAARSASSALITPWNFPAAIPAWKTAPALAYGNTVVMKLAQEAPLTGLHLAACFEEAGLPAGVLNVVIGRGSAVGTPLVAHPEVRAISFTGSVPVGEQVRDEATALGKRVQLELGGHNPLIVMADADLDRAVERPTPAPSGRPARSARPPGASTSRTPVYDDFRQRLARRIERGVGRRPGRPRRPRSGRSSTRAS